MAAVESASSRLQEDIVAQTADPGFSCPGIISFPFLDPGRYRHYFSNARVIVSHAGIGSILAAQELSKPIILFPRMAKLGEHRNDHQQDTVKNVINLPGIYVADTSQALSRILEIDNLPPAQSRSVSSPLALYLSAEAEKIWASKNE